MDRAQEDQQVWPRLWWGATALCAVFGVVISVYNAANSHTGHFSTALERALNTFTFFTILSNLLVGAAVVLLVIKPHRSSFTFSVFRLIGVVAIAVTGIVYHVALAGLFDLQGWERLGDQLVHTAVPLLAVIGWLWWGPRGLTSWRIVRWSLVFPIGWLGFTLIRGAFVKWYPYPFVDVTRLGYGGTLLNCVWVSLLLLGLAAGAHALDGVLGRSRP
jgi:hypothetical protein